MSLLLLFSGSAIAPVPTPTPPAPFPPISMDIPKRYYYKVYDKNLNFLTTWSSDVISDPQFRTVLNGGAGQLSVRLARPYNAFGEGLDVTLQNRVELWCVDGDNQAANGSIGTLWDFGQWDQNTWDSPIQSYVKIYSGYISAYAPTIEDENQFIDVTLLGYIADATNHILQDGSGNTTITYTAQDPAAIMQDILDKYRAQGGINLNYTNASLVTVGVSITYSFQYNTIKEAMDKVLDFCPYGWFYYVDSSGIVHLTTANIALADHVVTIGKDVASFAANVRIENLANTVYVIGGGSPNLYNKYSRAGSISTYGTFEQANRSINVEDNPTADLIAKSMLDRLQTPETRLTIKVIDNNGQNRNRGQNIEAFGIGQTLQIKDLKYGNNRTYFDIALWDASVWDITVQLDTSSIVIIQSIQYSPDFIEIEASSRLPEIPTSVNGLARLLDDVIQQNLPVAPSVRTV